MQQIKIAFLGAVINATKTTVYKFFKFYIATVVLAVAFFTHFFFPHPEYDYKVASDRVSQHEDAISSANQNTVQLAKDLYFNKINFDDFKKGVSSNNQIESNETEKLEIALENFNTIRDAKKEKYFGFTSYNKFMWTFGLGMIITILSLRIMYYSHTIEESNRRNANASLGLIGGLIGGYMFAWIFYPEPDLPYSTYMTLLVSIGAIASVLGYFLSKSGYANRYMLKHKIRALMNLMVVKTTDLDLIKDIEVYTIEIVEPALNTLDD